MVEFTLLSAGFCTAPEHILQRGGRGVSVPLPALFALIKHPQQGYILFDTGYSHRFCEETSYGLNWLYGKMTPVTFHEADEPKNQLAARGIHVSEIRHVLISHFHGDHVGALRDFPNATLHYLPHAWEAVRGKTGMNALRRAYLPNLLPPDFEARGSAIPLAQLRPLPPEFAPFTQGVDLFGDESLWAVELPGHAVGQLGLIVRTATETYFLVADACWQSIAYRDYRLPSRLAYLLFPYPHLYDQTLKQIHRLWQRQTPLHIIPSHCEEAAAELVSPPPRYS